MTFMCVTHDTCLQAEGKYFQHLRYMWARN